MDPENIAVDMVVVGSGSAGMATAIVAAREGLDVLLLEKTPFFGGATAWSGGGCWVPDNHIMRSAGMQDSAEDAGTYIREVVGQALDETLWQQFLENSAEMLRYFENNTHVHFDLKGTLPDYFPELPGGSRAGRLVTPVEYDGRRLGDWFARLRPPLPEFNAPGGMMVDLADGVHLMNAGHSWRSLSRSLGLVSRYLGDRLRGYPRGMRLTMGNALAARLLHSALDAGVTLWHNSSALDLIKNNDRVAGVEIDREGRKMAITARRGVVLASGGFSSDPEMRRRHIPYAEYHQSLMPEGNTGDGIRMALGVGGTMHQSNPANAVWNIISLHHRPDGSVRKFPHLFLDKPMPGCIAVNDSGERFGNEASLVFTEAMHRTGSVPAWLICDGRFIRRHGLGLVYPGGWGRRRLVRDGYLINGESLATLAQKMAVPGNALEETVARFNRHAAEGKDPDFGRGDSAFDRAAGDAAHKPNPSLGPIEKAPFYAVRVYPGDATTTLGLKVDKYGRVMSRDNGAIAGLYAAGLDMNSLWAGLPPAGGSNHSLNLTMGYLIGRHLAGNESA